MSIFSYFKRRRFTAGMNTSRVEAFSDGVFAIAITLLILGVSVPETSTQVLIRGELLTKIIALWPKILSYIISFAVIGIFWVGHHIMFRFIKRMDRIGLLLNILVLMVIAFIPFSAALMGVYGREQIAVVIYGITLFLAGITFELFWLYASHNYRLIDQTLDSNHIQKASLIILVAPVIYLIAVILSVFNPLWSIVIYILVPLLYILPSPIDEFVTEI